MPHKVETSDGIVISDIPDNVSPNDPRLKDQVAQMRSAGQKSATFGPIQLTPEQAATIDPESAGGTAIPGALPDLVMEKTYKPDDSALAQGAGVLGRGMVKGAMSVPTMIADPITMLINKALPAEYQQLPPSEGLNLILKKLGVPESETKTQEILEAVGFGVGAGAAGIGTGAAMAAGAPALGAGSAMQEIGKTLATGPAQQMLGSVGSSGASKIAEQQGAGPLVQFGAGMAGGIGGSMAGNAMLLRPGMVNPAQRIIDDAVGLRTQPMTSDVVPPKTFAAKTAQALGEKIPVVGTGPIRAKQATDRIADVKDILRQFGADDAAAASDDVMADMLAKRGGNISRWSGMKNKVIDDLSIPKIADDGDTITSAAISVNGKIFEGPSHADAVQQATEQGLVKYTDRGYVDSDGDLLRPGWSDLFRTEKGKLVNRFQADEFFNTTASENMSRIVPMPLANKKIDDSIAFLKGLKNPSLWDPYIKELEGFKGSIDGQDLRNVEIGRATIGDVFGASDNDSVKRMGKKLVTGTRTEPGIYAAVNDDMGNYIKSAGSQKDFDKWKIANTELSKMMKDLELGILESTLEKGVDRPEVVKNMLFSKDRSVIQALNKNLTAKGRESARAAIMQEVGKKIGEEASPEKFLSELRKMKAGGDPVGVFFTGDDLKAVEGLTRVLKATSRASQAALNPPTGVQAVIPLSLIGMGGGSVALEKYFGKGLPGMLASVAVIGGAGGAARLYESAPVRNILMKLPTVAAGSAEEAALFKRLLEAAQAQTNKSKQETDER